MWPNRVGARRGTGSFRTAPPTWADRAGEPVGLGPAQTRSPGAAVRPGVSGAEAMRGVPVPPSSVREPVKRPVVWKPSGEAHLGEGGRLTPQASDGGPA